MVVDRRVQSAVGARPGTEPASESNIPATKVAGAESAVPSASEPRDPTYPLPIANNDSSSCSRARVKPSSTRTHAGSRVGATGKSVGCSAAWRAFNCAGPPPRGSSPLGNATGLGWRCGAMRFAAGHHRTTQPCGPAASTPTHFVPAAKKLKSGTNTTSRKIAMYQPNTKLQNRPRKKLGQVIQVNPGKI